MLIIICLYSQAGAIPQINDSILTILDFSIQPSLNLINIVIAGVLLGIVGIIIMLMVINASWETYSEKKIVFKLLSMLITFVRQPFFSIEVLFSLNCIFEFYNQDIANNLYMAYLGIICACLNGVLLTGITYFGAYFFNLSIPNSNLPWGNVSHQPQIIQGLFKLFLMLTFKSRGHTAILYSLSVITFLMCISRLYTLIFKSPLINESVYQVALILESANVHLMLMFLVTVITSSQQYFYFFVVAFIPMTCSLTLYLKSDFQKNLLLRLINSDIGTNKQGDRKGSSSGAVGGANDQIAQYLYLISLSTGDYEGASPSLTRLEQAHYSKCSIYYDSMKDKLHSQSNQAIQLGLLNKNLFLENGALGDDLDANQVTDGSANYEQESDIDTQMFKSTVAPNFLGFKSTAAVRISQSQKKIMALKQPASHRSSMALQMERIEEEMDGLHHKKITNKSNGHSASQQLGLHFIPEMEESARFDKIMEEIKEEENGITTNNNNRGSLIFSKNEARSASNEVIQQDHHNLKDDYSIIKSKFNKSDKKTNILKENMAATTTTILKDGETNSKWKNESQAILASSQNFNQNLLRTFMQQNSLKSALELKTFDVELKREHLHRLANHYFNHHLYESSNNEKISKSILFKLKLFKVYFTFQVLNNPYLANFQMFQNEDDGENFSDDSDGGFISSNIRLLHQRYIDELIIQKQRQEEDSQLLKAQLGQLDLKTMLEVNQLTVQYEKCLEKSTETIHDFWESLLNATNTKSIFTRGILISSQLAGLQRLMGLIMEKSSANDTKIYIQMAYFYNMVVFKPNEASDMFEKARVSLYSKKLSRQRDDHGTKAKGSSSGGDLQEKSILMVKINLKKPMKITFANKSALRIIQYSASEIGNITINNLMPKMIDEIHHIFVEEFVATGRARMLKNRKENFIKNKFGNIVPVCTYLFINSMSRKHMILLFEENPNFQLYDEPFKEQQFAFILTSEDYRVSEVSHNFQYITGISPGQIKKLEKESYQTLTLDDLVKVQNYDCSVSQLKELHDTNEAEVIFVNLKQNETNMNPDQRAGQLEQTMTSVNDTDSDLLTQQQINILKLKNNHQILSGFGGNSGATNGDSRHTPVYMIKVNEIKYLGDKFRMRLIGFRRMTSLERNDNRYFEAAGHLSGIANKSPFGESMLPGELLQAVNMDVEDGSSTVSMKNRDPNDNTGGLYSYDMSSQSSSASRGSQNQSTMTILNVFQQHAANENSPKTLRLLINIVLFIAIIMIAASTAVLELVYSNLDYAFKAIDISQHSYQSSEEQTQQKNMIRLHSLVNQGIISNTGIWSPDRIFAYEIIEPIEARELHDDTGEIVKMIQDYGASLISSNIQCAELSQYGDMLLVNMGLVQAQESIINNAYTFVAEPNRNEALEFTQVPLLNLKMSMNNILANLGMPGDYKAIVPYQHNISANISMAERSAWFILNNTNWEAYTIINEFGPAFGDLQTILIEQKLSYVTGASIALIVLIVASGLIILPLFGRIQTRIQELMKLFFLINTGTKQTVIKKIKEFQKNQFTSQSFSKTKAGNLGQTQIEKKDDNNVENVDSPGKSSVESSSKIAGREIFASRNALTKKQSSQNIKIKATILQKDGDTKDSKKGGKNKMAKKFLGTKTGVKELEGIEEESKDGSDHESSQTSQNQSESSSQHSERKKKKHRKIRKAQSQISISDQEEKSVQQQNMEQASMERDLQAVREFAKYISKRRMIQSVFISIILLSLASYFLVMYLLGQKYHVMSVKANADMNSIFNRFKCQTVLMSLYVEQFYYWNLTDDTFQLLDDQIQRCLAQEIDFTNSVINGNVPFMDGVLAANVLAEDGNICPIQTESVQSPPNCEVLSTYIAKQGLTAFFFGLIKTFKQMQLDLRQSIRDRTFDMNFVQNQLNNTIADYFDVMYQFVFVAWINVENTMIPAGAGYFQGQNSVVNAIYGAYVAATIFLLIVFFGGTFLKLKKEMLQSNRMLYLIDYDALSEQERQTILSFLVNY